MPSTVNIGSFIGRSRTDVAQRIVNRLPKLTPYTYLGEGSIIKAIAEAVAFELGNAYSILSYGYTQQIVSTASGSGLDALGVLYGVTRRVITSIPQQASFYFYLASSSTHQTGVPNMVAESTITIPAGTTIKTRDDAIGTAFQFETLSEVIFSPGDNVHFVSVTPTDTTITTNMAPHTLRTHNFTGTGYEYVYCTNPVELNTDTTAESDEDYRARIISSVRSIASANIIALRMAALSVNHVRDAYVLDRIYGPSTARVVITVDSGAVGTELTSVKAAVEDVRPVGTYVEVVNAVTYDVEIEYGFLLEDTAYTASVTKAINTAITFYVGNLAIGKPLRKSQLLEKMFLAAPITLDTYITSIKVNGINFIGDSYALPEDGVFNLLSANRV